LKIRQGALTGPCLCICDLYLEAGMQNVVYLLVSIKMR
jgi:hypothetical protein